ncbi:MAG TPA: EamA family transporter [Puia sp.]|nr:EamA family transporter [Puia sp.]
MLYLIVSIVITSYLTLCFKFIEKYHIPPFQAIMFNHFTCVVTGCFFNGSTPFHESTLHEPWFRYSLLMSAMFISIFNIVGFTTQKIGVAVASVANKLSLVIPFIFSVYLYNEKISALKIIGIVIAVIAVVLTCLPAKTDNGETKKPKLSPVLLVLVPAILFFSSGLFDTMIKYVEQKFLNDNNYNQYLITTFASAGTIGSIILIFLVLTGRQKFTYKSIIAGICIGFPNYFSIWALIKVLKTNAGNSSAIIPINNMGIVLFSSVMGWLLFKEKLSVINWLGIILSLGAISLIAFG